MKGVLTGRFPSQRASNAETSHSSPLKASHWLYFLSSKYNLHSWRAIKCYISEYYRYHSGDGLSQWEVMLHCYMVSHRLRPNPERIPVLNNVRRSGPRFNINMTSYQCRKSHCGDKMILRPSYLHNGLSYINKMISLYWIRALTVFWTYPSPSSGSAVISIPLTRATKLRGKHGPITSILISNTKLIYTLPEYKIGHVTLVFIIGTTSLVPYHWVKPLQVIWWSSTHRYHVWVILLQVS